MNNPNPKPMREGFVLNTGADDNPYRDDPAPARPRPAIREIEAAKAEAKPAPEVKPEQQPAQLPEDTWPLVIKLEYKPIRKTMSRDAETIKELTFREPTAGDLIRAGGNPVRTGVVEITLAGPVYDFIIEDAKMIRLMASLSGVAEQCLFEMDPRDYASGAYRLRRFFLAQQGYW